MQMYLISDNVDTLTGMRLVGIDGSIVHSAEELKKTLDILVQNKNIGIILLTEIFSTRYKDLVNTYKLNYKLPLFIDIPDRHGTGRKANFITDYVNEAIGVKL